MTRQNADGSYAEPWGAWDFWSNQAYYELCLERSIAGVCTQDTDQDGVCDEQDNCRGVANPYVCMSGANDGGPCNPLDAATCPDGTCAQPDSDQDGIGDACDCGNNIVDPLHETCDGTADAACPGACIPAGSPGECTCSNVCGDNVVGPGEQCDGTSDAACPGQCGAPDSPGACLCRCGNNIVDSGEQCDGTEVTACNGGQCAPPGSPNQCTCLGVCGNNTIDPGETCDGTSDAACPGLCRPAGGPNECTCPPTCGNNTIEPGEQCDGTSAAACGPAARCFPPGDARQCTCDPCGDGVKDPGEDCDDGNNVDGLCDSIHPQKVVDGCTNQCKNFGCKDPSRIKLGSGGLGSFQFHGRIEPGRALETATFGIRITNEAPGDNTVYAVDLTTGVKGVSGRYRYRNSAAARTGGIAKIDIRQRGPNSYAVSLKAYGDLHKAGSQMTTHVTIGGQEWVWPGSWSRTPSGWVFRQ
jgi:hypothetical protein